MMGSRCIPTAMVRIPDRTRNSPPALDKGCLENVSATAACAVLTASLLNVGSRCSASYRRGLNGVGGFKGRCPSRFGPVGLCFNLSCSSFDGRFASHLTTRGRTFEKRRLVRLAMRIHPFNLQDITPGNEFPFSFPAKSAVGKHPWPGHLTGRGAGEHRPDGDSLIPAQVSIVLLSGAPATGPAGWSGTGRGRGGMRHWPGGGRRYRGTHVPKISPKRFPGDYLAAGGRKRRFCPVIAALRGVYRFGQGEVFPGRFCAAPAGDMAGVSKRKTPAVRGYFWCQLPRPHLC